MAFKKSVAKSYKISLRATAKKAPGTRKGRGNPQRTRYSVKG